MNITLDLPEDILAVAEAVAKRDSRSIGSVIADCVLKYSLSPPVIKQGANTNPFLRGQFVPGVEEVMNRPLYGTPVDDIISEGRERA